jgi:hypothetical protein
VGCLNTTGRHHGRYYDGYGRPTPALAAFFACAAEGHAARRRAKAIVLAAPPCEVSTPMGEARYNHGTWERYACAAPRAPHKCSPQGDEAGAEATAVCACLDAADVAAGGWDAPALGMEEDTHLPQKYAGCEGGASQCVVRVR